MTESTFFTPLLCIWGLFQKFAEKYHKKCVTAASEMVFSHQAWSVYVYYTLELLQG